MCRQAPISSFLIIEYQKNNNPEWRIRVEEERTKAVLRYCKKCGHGPFEKDRGCNSVTCPKCRFKHCFICGKPVATYVHHFGPGKCPLFDDTQARLRSEAARAEKRTITTLAQLYQPKLRSASIERSKITETSTARHGWKARCGIKSSDYQDHLDEMIGQGYHLTNVSAYTVSNCLYYATIWNIAARSEWKTRSRMSSAIYQERLDTFTAEGFRPSRVNGYTLSDTVFYNVLWEKSSGTGWYTKFGMTSDELQKSTDYHTSKGYWMKSVCGYSNGRETQYTAIWETNPRFKWAAKWGMTVSRYQIELDAKINEGYRLIHVSAYTVNDTAYFAAIWNKSPGRWYTRGSMSSGEFQSELDVYINKGYRVEVISGYSVKSSSRFAALWVKDD